MKNELDKSYQLLVRDPGDHLTVKNDINISNYLQTEIQEHLPMPGEEYHGAIRIKSKIQINDHDTGESRSQVPHEEDLQNRERSLFDF